MNIKLLKDEPKIILSEKAYEKMKYYVKYSDKEVGWLGSVTKNESTYIVTDVYLVEQEVNGTTCELSPEGIINLYLEREKSGKPNDIKFWGHSHVNMSTAPSSQDDTQFEEFISNNDFFIRLIMNKNDNINLSLFDKDKNIFVTEMIPVIEGDENEEIKKELAEKVKEKVYKVPNTYFKNNYMPYGDSSYYMNNKNKKKENVKDLAEKLNDEYADWDWYDYEGYDNYYMDKINNKENS